MTAKKDDVVIFLSGHGLISNPRVDGVDPDNDGEKRDNGYLVNSASCATGLEVLWDGELRSDLASINANRIIVLGDFSFPSGFNKDLSQVTNVLYLAGAKGEEFEVGGTIQNGVFTEKFINRGIRECRADDSQQNPHGDDNDKVTIEEAYDYANHVKIPGAPGAKPNIVDNLANDVHPRTSGDTDTC